MAKPRLIYDGNCPVCTNYIRLIRKKIPEDQLDYYPTGGMLDDFQYVNANNQVYQGNNAIQQLANDFPQILEYAWMLPSKYKVGALQTAYKVGSAVRKVYSKVKKGCGCGKKKR